MTQIVHYDPYDNLGDFQRDIEKLFFGYAPRLSNQKSFLKPAVDVVEDDKAINFHVELPGVAKEDLKINIKDQTLSISGEKKRSYDNKDKKTHFVGRSYGSFELSYQLPKYVNADAVDAKINDGILDIKIAKKEEVKPREINIK